MKRYVQVSPETRDNPAHYNVYYSCDVCNDETLNDGSNYTLYEHTGDYLCKDCLEHQLELDRKEEENLFI